MGLLSQIKRSLSPSLQDKVKAEARAKADGLRELSRNGASPEQIEKYINEMMADTEFYQILGNLKNIAPRAIGLCLMKHHTEEQVDENIVRSLMEDFTQAQQTTDKFFQNSQMRTWVNARALKEKFKDMNWEIIDQLLSEDDSWGNEFRQELWWIIPWSFAIADEVEERHGDGSCDAEKFHMTWREMTNPETVNAYIKTLSPEQVAYYRCTD